jgi:hypothetical protein
MTSVQSAPITFLPGLRATDPTANYWMTQVTVRLRREVCWRWQQQGITTPAPTLPPPVDPLVASLDLTRYWAEKCQFFQTDVTAKYLSEKLRVPPPPAEQSTPGSMGWAIATLQLDAVSSFVLSLGLLAAFDHAAGSVMAACLNEATATQPTLALAQQLWDEPEAVLAIADLAHPLWRTGLLQLGNTSNGGITWNSAILVSPAVATQLLFAEASLPQGLQLLETLPEWATTLPERARLVAWRLHAQPAQSLRVVPIRGAGGISSTALLHGMAQITGRPIVMLQGVWTDHPAYLKSLATLCWLRGMDLFIPKQPTTHSSENRCQPSSELLALRSIPATVFLGVEERKELSTFPSLLLLPMVEVPRLSYGDRLQNWQRALGTSDPTLAPGIAECSRRFRYEPETIQTICDGLQGMDQAPSTADLLAACRAELDLDLGELAQEVMPRFTREELVLPPKQQVLFQEIEQAMRALTQVHYDWGTARAWNECGISVLFAGPPGTGKTMAAEILAARLDLPMYRIDLSQVINKYIGETEKNLKRLFDAADVSDTILFFDEADALFGRRTEVKDAHDRYANLEISYLLERMERFKGLAILATNRKKDLDEAFLRRLRYIVDFPMPDIPERKRLWQQVIPEKVDATALDFDFLARQFPLAGGHIRSIVFNACLQTANSGDKPQGMNRLSRQLTMEPVITAVKREYDKLNRSVSLEQFGTYAKVVEGVEV